MDNEPSMTEIAAEEQASIAPTTISTVVDGIKAAAAVASSAATSGGASPGSISAWTAFEAEVTTLLENLVSGLGVIPAAAGDAILPTAVPLLMETVESILAHISMEIPTAFAELRAKL